MIKDTNIQYTFNLADWSNTPWAAKCHILESKLYPKDILSLKEYFTADINPIEYAFTFRDILKEITGFSVRISSSHVTNQYVHYEITDETLFDNGKYKRDWPVAIVCIHFGYDWRDKRQTFPVEMFGEATLVKMISQKLRAIIGKDRIPTVKWKYTSKGSCETAEIALGVPDKIYPEFYPFIPGNDVNAYLEAYKKSRASILFMLGPPGTGKTSLIRHFIHNFSESAMITYEEKIFHDDQMFVEFMTSDTDLLVVEDADTMLGSRSSEGNTLMAKFLNITDGLIKFNEKKVIFTTNLTSFNDVDPALIRPGRCYDAINFRPLTWYEAVKAAQVVGLSEPAHDGPNEYTLADLFNQQKPEIKTQRFGFAA